MTNTPQRGSRTSSPAKEDQEALVTDERRPSPFSSNQGTKAASPEEGQFTRPSHPGKRDQGRSSVNFLKKNRQACRKCENLTGVPRIAGEPSKETVVAFPPRIKLGQPPVIGDDLGTSSMFGSSFFMGPGHYGVREPVPKKTVKKRAENKSDEE